MKDKKYRYSVSQLLNFIPGSYFERTSRPIYAIVFLLPFIIFYELGTLLINTDLLRSYWQGRVVAFSWLQDFLVYLGFGTKFGWIATPLAVVVILIALQIVSRKEWRFWFGDVFPMAVECILLAIPLIVLGMFLSNTNPRRSNAEHAMGVHTGAVLSCSSVTNSELPKEADSSRKNEKWLGISANIVTGIGAGIYEEFVFRLVLIVALMVLFQDVMRVDHKSSIILSILISAALFGAYHHIVYLEGQFVQSSPFSWAEFGFRTIAGIYFAILFAIRGFGITAGVHAFYDIIAVLMNAFLCQS